jgi:glycerate 2-kinase
MRRGRLMAKVKNREELLGISWSQNNRRAREIALDTIEALLKSADPKQVIDSKIAVTEGLLRAGGKTYDLDTYRRVIVVGGGKASGAMAEALENILGNFIDDGIIVVPKGTAAEHNTKKIRLHEASHPVPDKGSVDGAKKVVELVKHSQKNDLVICLISGGGSSLMTLPRKGVTLKDEQKTTDMLLKCGATINEINAVRKHLSDFKGGQLAKAAYPATVLGLLLSDVLGDPLDVIASGPTVPDSTSFSDAVNVFRRYGLWNKVPQLVRKVLLDGQKGIIEETPKTSNPIFESVHNIVVGNNRLACEAAVAQLKKAGVNTVFFTSYLEGEAREIGTALSALVKEVIVSGNPVPQPAGIILGGETTVTVKGDGKGGRNQELALATSLRINGLENALLVALSTDGVDGPTDAAGALVDGRTAAYAQGLGLDGREYLRNNDSYSFFQRLGGHIHTGPTGTNVNDVIIMIVL